MPIARYTYERIPPLNDARNIEQHLTALYNLTELAEASKILLGAQYRSKGVVRFLFSFPSGFPCLFIVQAIADLLVSKSSPWSSWTWKPKFKFLKKWIWIRKLQMISLK